MVAEFRKMSFSFFELKKAIQVFHASKSIPLPDGDILAINLVENPTIRAKVKFSLANSGKTEIVELDNNRLAASMLFYCIQHKIPVPKDAKKEIVKTESGLALQVSLNGPTIN